MKCDNKSLKKGALYCLMCSLILFSQLFMYVLNSPVLNVMTPPSWFYYTCACFSHAVCIFAGVYVAYCCVSLFRLKKTADGVLIVASLSVFILVYVDRQVYSLYNFHIQGFVFDMLLDEGAGDVFVFDKGIYYKIIILFVLMLLSVFTLVYLTKKIVNVFSIVVKPFLVVFLFSLIAGNIVHLYGDFMMDSSIQRTSKMLPYYYAVSANMTLKKLGFRAPQSRFLKDFGGAGAGTAIYPLHPLETERPDTLYNIVFILIDSWSKKVLTDECMPNITSFANSSQVFVDNISCSNQTSGGLYGLFYGLPAYYTTSFAAAGYHPLFVQQLLRLGYQCSLYPSASLKWADMDKNLFSLLPAHRFDTNGETTYERDSMITADFISSVSDMKEQTRPSFCLVFYDLLHSNQLPKEKNGIFKPSWEYEDYTKLDNDMNPVPYFNLYRNACHALDEFVGEVLACLEKNDLLKNTIVVLTADHAQEFNENHNNSWGHAGNYSKYQIGVPLICHFPDKEHMVYRHRTSNYDIVSTIMKNYLGVANPLEDYCLGKDLYDTDRNDWIVVGRHELDYGYVLPNDYVIVRNENDLIDVYDDKWEYKDNYNVDIKAFNKANGRLNRFLKKE